ncbi:PREDICTED: filamin-A-interacting protein 1-like [Trachymyrmex septentrionalis]|uniref:filamin-A-interacting protein 1-like n=1 Tax=Trachymyrmex septentrionalis TaxID=34720 RepID=UPI00084F0EFF|nr:PREDICTED: filamin-A-interacting protein 1-like [Trachymyrmex septentrionalis]XP_018347953.1 PREDICTED: filamin-A-interacting protein 1-like [Trachymyrmex septentrionalis]XP_018347954.1 PREDICTED: filamin-A-interacting protein 1-like [Trachymyrmex septentrionalis]
MSKILGILRAKVISGTTIPTAIASNPSNLNEIEEEIKRLEQEQEEYDRQVINDYQERLDEEEREAKRDGIYDGDLKKNIEARKKALDEYNAIASNSTSDFYFKLKEVEEEIQKLKPNYEESDIQAIDYQTRLHELDELELEAKRDGIYDEDLKEHIEQARKKVIDYNVIISNSSNLRKKKIEEEIKKIKQEQKENERQAMINYQASLHELDELELNAKRYGLYNGDLKEHIEQARKYVIHGYNKLLLLIAKQNLTSEIGIDALEAEDFDNIDTRNNSTVRMSFDDQPETNRIPVKCSSALE